LKRSRRAGLLPRDQRRGAKRGSGWLRTTSATVAASAGPPPGGGRRNAEEWRIVGRCGGGGGVGTRAMEMEGGCARVSGRVVGAGVAVSKLEPPSRVVGVA